MLEKLGSFPTKRNLLILTITGFAAFIALMIIMYPYTAATAAAEAPSVIDFELTWGAARAQEILSKWGLMNLRDGQLILNLIDFAYMPAYTFFIAGAVLITARKIPDGRQKRIGFIAALLMFGSWACDAVENANLLQMFAGYIDEATALTASIMATIKFAFLFIAIGAFAGHLLRLLVLRVKHRVPPMDQNTTIVTK